MSYSTWHFITRSYYLGWLFRNMVLPRFVSFWQAMLRRHNDIGDLIAWILSQDGCFINTVHCAHVYNTQQSPTTNFTPHRADGIDGTCLTTCYGRPVDSGCVITLLGHRYFLRSSVLTAHEPVNAAEPMTYSGRPRFCYPVSIFFRRWPSLGTPLDHSEIQSL